MRTTPRRPSRGRWLLGGAVSLALAIGVVPTPSQAAHTEEPSSVPALTLVTLVGPGTAGSVGGTGRPADRAALLEAQDEVLEAADVSAEPAYRWTTALNGFAIRLTDEQAERVASHPDVARVEANTVLSLASSPLRTRQVSAGASPRLRGGAGVVVGVVDTGIGPDSPAFAEVPGLGREPRDFDGTCQAGEEWGPDSCTRKVVGARWFVAGFGPDRLRTSESLSPRDVLGHGTQVASVAAGNAGVTVRIDGRDAGRFGGVAPQARIAAYKACWAAPDPDDDGCATADLVTAVDRAVGDGVDVLNLSVAAGSGVDTLQLALLGAAEDDVVVVGAAGNSARSWASHESPWVTTVGSSVGQLPRAAARIAGGPRFPGAGRPTTVSAPVVLARRAAASGAEPAEAAQCRPGTLDARLVAGRIVVCERGGIARLDKSEVVAQADGRGMVLVNVSRGGLSADFHSVPTVHLGAAEGRRLVRWVRTRPSTRLTLGPDRTRDPSRRTADWSPNGDPRSPVLKPDGVAAADGVLAAQPDSTGAGWGLLTGSSAAAAHASGLAALLRARHDWDASVVRSMLVTTAVPLPGSSVLSQGTGALGRDVPSSHLALQVGPRQWRRALEERDLGSLNLTAVALHAGQRTAVRRVTNTGPRAEYFSADLSGFDHHRVTVRPQAVRLAPGESARFRLTVWEPASPHPLDDGHLVLRGARGGVTRIPVALAR